VAFKAFAVLILSLAVWLLATDGAAFIEFLRRHH
jgi:hypothetical protein